jgi:hypothetical protein
VIGGSVFTNHSPGNVDIAAIAENGKRRAPNAERFPVSTDQWTLLMY